MAIRLRQSEENGLALAQWLEQQPEVIQMLHPACRRIPAIITGNVILLDHAVYSDLRN